MKTCPKCGFENPEPNTSCVECGATFRADLQLEVDNPEVLALQKEIEGLRQELQGKDEELAGLQQTLDSKDKELAGVQLRLTTATKELEDLHNKTQPTQAVAIESYPLKKPEFHLEMKTSDKSLDLSTTAFHIRATLERTAEAIELLVQPGATVNVRMSDKQKWQRLTGGTRKTAAEGLILFDPTAAATARIGQST
jgi:DNA repair exonuclease SbcCD ATPase subunit